MRSQEPGRRLRRIRESLGLTTRAVEVASRLIATRHENDEFIIVISRLSEIENRGGVPTLYRLHSLCAIYRQDPGEVMSWYGADPAALGADSTQVAIDRTHPVRTPAPAHAQIPVPLFGDREVDESKTTFLSRLIERWGRMPLTLASSADAGWSYGWIGWDDWSMYPILQPGALVAVDEGRRKIARGGWSNEFDRPIYFVEHREGWSCSWCTIDDQVITLQPHPASEGSPRSFPEGEVEVLGQVVGVAMTFTTPRRGRKSFAAAR